MRQRRTVVFGPLLVSAAAGSRGTRAAVAQPLAPTPACGDHGAAPTAAEAEGPYFKPRSPERKSLLRSWARRFYNGAGWTRPGDRLPVDHRRIAGLLACGRDGRLRQCR